MNPNKITTGNQLSTFMTALNADATIDPTMLAVLVENGKTILEEEREWSVLRQIDTSKTVSTSNTWQTPIDLSTISGFSRFYVPDDGFAIRVFDASSNRYEAYSLKPFFERLRWRNTNNTAVYDENAKILYLNGTIAYSGALWLNIMITTESIDITTDALAWTEFPSRFLPILAYYAIGIFKGGVDYDSINKLMLPTNQATLGALKNAMDTWDNNKQLAEIQTNDPSENEFSGGWQSGRVNRWGDDY